MAKCHWWLDSPDDDFQPAPLPSPQDWLAVHRELGQAFEEFRRSHPNRPDSQRRSIKVLTHETGPMFGLTHCICFRCVVNGSNHLQESDRRPLHLCPKRLTIPAVRSMLRHAPEP